MARTRRRTAWRRGGDSNPRDPFESTRVPGVRVKPSSATSPRRAVSMPFQPSRSPEAKDRRTGDEINAFPTSPAESTEHSRRRRTWKPEGEPCSWPNAQSGPCTDPSIASGLIGIDQSSHLELDVYPCQGNSEGGALAIIGKPGIYAAVELAGANNTATLSR